jgi:hypothetical protein
MLHNGQEKRVFLSTVCRLTAIQWLPEIFSLGIKLSEREANQLSVCNTKFSKVRNNIYALPVTSWRGA